MFFKGSRYQNVGEWQLIDSRRRVIQYKKMRVISSPRVDWIYRVKQVDRLDLIAHEYYRDPERFWRICDANEALWPDDLVREVGRTILIPPLEG
jgi:hypothetical protein